MYCPICRIIKEENKSVRKKKFNCLIDLTISLRMVLKLEPHNCRLLPSCWLLFWNVTKTTIKYCANYSLLKENFRNNRYLTLKNVTHEFNFSIRSNFCFISN